nr:hypothetical protein [Nocardia pseudobrasiliensis]
MPIDERNSVENLLLLCSNCHDIIDKRKDPAEELRTYKVIHEHWCAVLRQAGRAWNIRYSSIDYVNLPRISMQTDGLGLQRIARDVGLDPTRTFRGQGFAVGTFVHRLQPIFENWNEQAVRLDAEHANVLEPGLTVAFDGPMRVMNPPRFPPRPLSGSWAQDPYLIFALGDRAVKIRFDPAWLTTTTATTDLDAARREPITYAGLGVVVSVSETEIKVSARLFGQPKSPVRALLEYARAGATRELDLADFGDDLSGSETREIVTTLSPEPTHRSGIVLHFDEDQVFPMQIEKEVFQRLRRVVPEYRRDLTTSPAFTLTAAALRQTGLPSTAAIAMNVLARTTLWKAVSVPSYDNMIRHKNVAVMVVAGLTVTQRQNLHDLLRHDIDWYLGALEYAPDEPIHKKLYEFPAKYHIAETNLHILYSAADSEFGDVRMSNDLIENWERSRLFAAVEWEEDLEHSERDSAEAGHILEALFAAYDPEAPAFDPEPQDEP